MNYADRPPRAVLAYFGRVCLEVLALLERSVAAVIFAARVEIAAAPETMAVDALRHKFDTPTPWQTFLVRR